VAIDPRIAFQAVATHYEKLATKDRPKEQIARDYLSKIVQLPIRLREPSLEELGRFVDEKVFSVSDDDVLIGSVVPKTDDLSR
jgi:hypothetical protein